MQDGTMIQYFHWYLPDDGNLWKQIKEDASNLKDLGFSTIWFPPAFKGASRDTAWGMMFMICMILENLIRRDQYAQNMVHARNT